MEQIAARKEGRIRDDVAEFVADHAGQFRLVEQMDDRAIEIHAIHQPQAGQQFAAQRGGVHVLRPRDEDGRDIRGQAQPFADAPGERDETLAPMHAEAHILPSR